jgi:dienelactone hydrolase
VAGEWNETPGNLFYGQVDLDRVGLIGHSRGGEAIAHASVLNTRLYDPVDNVTSADDFGFGIRGIVALAPSDNRYQPGGRPIHVDEADYLLLAGAHDQDMFYLDGLGQYTRATFDENPDGFKAIAYLYRANHGNFNEVWGDADQGKFESILLNRKPLMTAEEQQQAAKVLITGFLEASLKDKDEYRAMFYRPAGARDWLPDDIVVTQYRDATFTEVAGNNQLDPAKIDIPGGRAEITGVANSQIIGYRLKNDETKVSNRGLLLEWPAESEPTYTVRLPGEREVDLNLTLAQALTFNLVDMSENETPPTVWIELETGDGATARLPLSHFGSLAPALPARLTKAEWIAAAKGYEIDTPTPYERLPQTFDLPLDEFAAVNPDFRAENLSEIRIRFAGQDAGKVMIDDMGFRNPSVNH